MRKSVKYNLSQRKKQGFLGLSKTQLKSKVRNNESLKRFSFNKKGRAQTLERKRVMFRKGIILTLVFFIAMALIVWFSIWMFG